MATAFENRLNELQRAGTLPGGVYLATNASGKFTYTKAFGVSTTSPTADPKPSFTPDTRLVIASCTKLFTAVAVLQVVESGKFSLDEDLRHSLLPELDKLQIIESADPSTGILVLKDNTRPITLRHLLTHTSGLGYDLVDAPLLAWHAQHGTTPWTGSTIPARMAVPLQFAPGSGWRYGVGTDWAGLAVERAAGTDWAGLAVERAAGTDLESFLRARVWAPLGIAKATFWREKSRVEDPAAGDWAEESMLLPPAAVDGVPGAEPGAESLPVACPLQGFDMLGGLTQVSGGGGLSCSAAELVSLLGAVLTRDPALLSAASWDELLAPQLGPGRPVGEEAWETLNRRLREDDQADVDCGMNLPRDLPKSWSLGGLVLEQEAEGGNGVRVRKGSVLWGGMTGMEWFVDRETGLCGLAAPQVFTFGQRPIHDLNGLWLKQIYDWYDEHKKTAQSV